MCIHRRQGKDKKTIPMKTDDENNEWKAEAPYLASLPKENPFSIPELYFEALPGYITNAVYIDQLKQEIPATGFSVPEAYFSELHDQLLGLVSEEVLKELPEKDGFQTPDLYFQQLQAKILARTVDAAVPAEVITQVPAHAPSKIVRLWHSDLLKYASAACFVLVTAFGLYLNQQRYQPAAQPADMANEQLLYDMDEQEIIDHIESKTPEMPKIKVTDAELETYILNNYSQSELSTEIN